MKYFKNTSWLFAEKILRMVMGLFVGIWVARYLGSEKFGLLSYAQSFVALFTALATFGLDGIVVRELVKDHKKANELLGTSFVLKLLGAFLVLLILAVAINFTSNDKQTNILVFIIASGTIFQSFNVLDFYFQSKVMSKYVVYANTITLLLATTIKITLILINAELIYFAIVALLDSLVLACGLFYYFHNNMDLKISNFTFKKTLAYDLLKDSWPLIPHKISFMVIANIDQVMIGNMLNSQAVGIYAMAYKIIMILYSFSSIFTRSVFPALIKKQKESNMRFVKLYQFMLLIAVIFIVTYFVFGKLLLLNLFGKEYMESIAILNILIFTIIFSFLSTASGKWYIVNNLTKLFLFRTISAMTINITLNWILIQHYGIYGSVYATLFTMFYLSYLVNYLNVKTFTNLKLIHLSFNIYKRTKDV